MLYGLTDFGLAQREGISREEAGAFIKRYFEKYEAVKRWRDDIVNQTRRDGYAETLAGRRRYIPDIHSSNFNVRMGAERIAINMPIQGTASDIIKIAMIRLDAELTKRRLASRMLLQVHDELIFEGPHVRARRAARPGAGDHARVAQAGRAAEGRRKGRQELGGHGVPVRLNLKKGIRGVPGVGSDCGSVWRRCWMVPVIAQ